MARQKIVNQSENGYGWDNYPNCYLSIGMKSVKCLKWDRNSDCTRGITTALWQWSRARCDSDATSWLASSELTWCNCKLDPMQTQFVTPGYRSSSYGSSGKIRVAARRCRFLLQYQLHPLAVGKILTPAFYVFRPFCPAFSFFYVDTYAIILTWHRNPLYHPLLSLLYQTKQQFQLCPWPLYNWRSSIINAATLCSSSVCNNY